MIRLFDTAYYLHYVLDNENDSHYTEDLMRLSPACYLWHELKERLGFSKVVFVNLTNGELMLETFDNASFQFLQPVKKNWLGRIVEQPVIDGICCRTFYPSEIKKEECMLLEFLLKCQQNHKRERTAVVCTAESLERLYERSNQEGRNKLASFIDGCALSAILVVRLDMSTASLRKTFLQGRCFLSELDGNIKETLCNHTQQPLLSELSRQLGGQLVDFSHQNTDMVNLLMYDALENGTGLDNPDQLRDQAEYLRLCLDNGVALAEAFQDAPRHEPLKRDTVYGKLADLNFRSCLRADADHLRSQNAQSRMADLFCREFGLFPEDVGIRELCYEDELYRKVCSLDLPEAYLEENMSQGRGMQELRKAVATLWNKPRNPKVCEMIRHAVDAAMEAVSGKDWVTLNDAITLLTLCARQICAEPVLNDNLDEIFNTGRELLRASADLNRQQQSFRDMYALGQQDYNRTDFGDYRAAVAVHVATDTVLESKARKLGMLRRRLYDTILYFNDHPLNEQVEQSLREFMHRWKDRLDQAQHDDELFGDFIDADSSDDGSPYGDL